MDFIFELLAEILGDIFSETLSVKTKKIIGNITLTIILICTIVCCVKFFKDMEFLFATVSLFVAAFSVVAIIKTNKKKK